MLSREVINDVYVGKARIHSAACGLLEAGLMELKGKETAIFEQGWRCG